MIKNKKLLLLLSALFLLTESLLGLLLQTVQGNVPINLRYTAVILACLFCVVFAERSRAYLLTQLALIGTVGADYFLVYRSDMQQLPAMLLFSAVQLCYCDRLRSENESPTRRRIGLLLRAVLSLAVPLLTLLLLGESCDAVALVSTFYYVNLILNVLFAFLSFKKNPILAVGLLLFLLCDTVIGLSFLGSYLPVSNLPLLDRLLSPGFDLAWAFYLPSQALLAVSLLPLRMRTNAR